MSRIPTLTFTPGVEEIKPCEGRSHQFESTHYADHAIARTHCLGAPGRPACPALDWCVTQREAFQRTEYSGGLHGTWHGVLFVKGRSVKTEKTVARAYLGEPE